ncbi:LIC_12936 family protein [Leptospira noguchii]|uniref:Uncharacterized protein n=4 Tax=Leptospira noguchii TaxID=28182 RepID=M6Y2T6_9LEPT|nr:hypothetical protein [Leptospira noguchii]EMM99743.1 hypothetical protein LEP1GSC035_2872 [Leptospira noguchii str. 2007001578]EMO54682.1 hypothetical protein LEP1GSC172_2620 [Leptospira noguchii]EMO88642.1 hypothetical protein LEP1GSC024_0778 [Leptospira noguchii str. 2001034031]EPE85847.1 hypothetical protein LEP1GSC021_4242 [Leptospira noguchii str. 1993005606]EQA71131.1 hypothetical protein LEP1GSC059_1202 [Leptospira noguchii serovar Panama str. CZ214]
MKEKLFYFLILISTFAGISSQEFEPDGKVKILPYEQGQVKDLEVLGKDIIEFHKRIESRLGFLNQRKQIQDNLYSQFIPAYEDQIPQSRNRYMLDLRFVLKVSGTGATNSSLKLESVVFWSRKSLISKMRPQYEEISILKNDKITNEGPNSIELVVRKKTDSGTKEMVYNVATIREPAQRIKLVRIYRTNLLEIIRRIDKYVEGSIKTAAEDVETTLKEVENGGPYQENPKD